MKKVITRLMIPLLYVLICGLTLSYTCQAQSVRKEQSTINGKKYDGFSILIEGSLERVEKFWTAELNDKAKLRRKRDFTQLEDLKLDGEYHSEAIFYNRMTLTEPNTKIWVALDPETVLVGAEGVDNLNSALEALMGSLPLKFEIYLLENQISDTERVIEFTERQKQKNARDIEIFNNQLHDAETELSRLSNAMGQLELEILALKQKITNTENSVVQNDADLKKFEEVLQRYKREIKLLKN